MATTWPSRSASADTQTGPSARRGDQLETELGGPGPEAVGHLTDHGGAVDRLQVEREAVGVQPGQVEQVLDQSLEAARLAADDGGCFRRVVGGPVDHRLGVAADRGQRCPQLVGDGQEELAFLLPGPHQVGAHGVDRLGQLGEFGILVGRTGTVASRSPEAIRRVAGTAATSGRVKRRARAVATTAATTRPMAPISRKYRMPSAGSWIWRVTTSTGR